MFLSIKPDSTEAAPFSPNGSVSSTAVSESTNLAQYDQTPLKRIGRRLFSAEEATAKRLQSLYKAVYYFRAYSTYEEMASDLQLMFTNAKTYNKEGSSMYSDAELLDSIVKKRIRSFVQYIATPTRPITKLATFILQLLFSH
ncbi:unnamed protein product [Trichobilharzia regenti]|nr:unnamed protein product [Trichobilharzia regenti]